MTAKPLIPVVTKVSGKYTLHDDSGTLWEYELRVSALGTKSERHIGVLHLNKAAIPGAVKDARVQTTWGQMQFHDGYSDQGFLLAGFGGHALDSAVGVLLPAASPTPDNARAEGTIAEWRFQVSLRARGSKSESRVGHLWRGGEEVIGHKPNERLDTPLGKLCYTGSPSEVPSYGESGWLLRGCYDRSLDNNSPGPHGLDSR